VSSEQHVSVSDYDESICTRLDAVMDAARGGLNEARLVDDVDGNVVDCSTTPRRCHSSTPSSVESTSCSCSLPNDESLTMDVDDACPAPAQPCESLAQVADDTTATASSTSVPLLEQLVSSPCDVITSVSANCVVTRAVDSSRHSSQLNKSFLQKLESFVSSVGQVIPTPLSRPPLTGWIRRPVFPSQSDSSSSGNRSAVAKRLGPVEVSSYRMSPLLQQPAPEADSSRPLDLSAKRMESPILVDNTRLSQRALMQTDSGYGVFEGRFVDASDEQSGGANSLACLERDFGEHSSILTQLESSRDRQRQAAVALSTTVGAATRRCRVGAVPGLTTAYHPAGAPVCSIAAPRAEESRPLRSFLRSSRQLPYPSDRTSVVDANKLNSRHPVMSTTTTTATALRCLQCGRTFFSLPELTLHMIQSAHYANLICAAAACNGDDEEDCVMVDAYNSRQSSSAAVDQSSRRTGALQLTRGRKSTTEMAAGVIGVDRLCRNGSETRCSDYLDAAVSPVRSLDDESVSSAGLTETESLRSPTSTGSPTSPSYENAASDDDLALMSHLIRLQPLLSRTVLDHRQAAPGGHVDWTAMGLTAAEKYRRQPVSGRPSKTSVRELDHSPAAESLPIDLRNQRADGRRYRESHVRETASRPSSTAYLEKLLDDVRGYRKSLSVGVKRSASSRLFNGKHRTKKHRTYSISSSDCSVNGRRLNGVSRPTSGEVYSRKRDDSGEVASSVRMSPSEKQQSSQPHEMSADRTRRSSPKEAVIQPIVVDDRPAGSPALSVRGRDAADLPTTTRRDLRRSSVDKDQSEYAARFGKYYRLAQELANKTD